MKSQWLLLRIAFAINHIIGLIAICYFTKYLYTEYALLQSWASVTSQMETLAWATTQVPPIGTHQKTTEFRAIFGDVLMGIFEPGTATYSPLFDGKGMPIFYWLPNDPVRKIVFVSSAPVRNGFSTNHYRWVVTADGQAKAMTSEEFHETIKKNNESSGVFSTSITKLPR